MTGSVRRAVKDAQGEVGDGTGSVAGGPSTWVLASGAQIFILGL